MKRFHICSVQFICITWKSCNCAVLPKWAYRVDSCPDPKDIYQWINASKALNCHHDLMSKDPKEQELVYHCLPSIYLNETVEFCGRSLPIAPGDFCNSFIRCFEYVLRIDISIKNYPVYNRYTVFLLGVAGGRFDMNFIIIIFCL